MIRIGCVNPDTSHPLAFSQYLLEGNRARYVAVYNDSFRGEDQIEAFMRRRGLEKRCDTLEKLAEMVDIGFIQDCNWDRHVEEALPFLERGKPVFIDKPLVGNVADCRRLEELAARGAVILGSSSLRYAREIAELMAQPEEERGRVVSATGFIGVDEFNYGCHAVEGLASLTGTGAVSCRFVGRAQAEKVRCETFFVRFESGVSAVYHSFLGVWQPFNFVAMTTKTTHVVQVAGGGLYAGMLDRICDFMETGAPMPSLPELTEAVKIMLAGRLSRERGGVEVALADLSEDDPGFDGAAFAEGYAAAASPSLYLEGDYSNAGVEGQTASVLARLSRQSPRRGR